MSEILIKKKNGELEAFDVNKLRESLLGANTSILHAETIAKKIEQELKPNMTTDEIYREAFLILKQTEKPSAMRYSIRRSLIELGPTGFPFEKFIEKVFQKRGYQTQVGVNLQGKCVDHEVDVVALSENGELFLCEVKFHNDLGTKSDTKTALYIKARFDDLKDVTFNLFGKSLKADRMITLTNTKFTNNSIKYAKCVGMDLISWDYPKNGNLHSLIYESDTYPITILESLTKTDKLELSVEGIITCDDLLESKHLQIFDPEKIAQIKEEIEIINAK